MIKCPNCAHDNADGSIACISCGFMFDRHTTLTTRSMLPGIGKENTAATHSAHLNKLPADGLAIYVGQSPEPMIIVVKERLTLGRRKDVATPDLVDLTPYDAYRLGVSRNHAILTYKENHLYIHDIGSVNGTWLNGQRLKAYELYALPAGTPVSIGQLPIYVYYQELPPKGK